MLNTDNERLQAFETMLKAVEEHYQKTCQKLQELKAQNKVKTVTYCQLMGDKFQDQRILSLYTYYELIDQVENNK